MKTAEIRKILRHNFGQANVIMKRNGDIMVFGVVPNTNDEAWYLAHVMQWENIK